MRIFYPTLTSTLGFRDVLPSSLFFLCSVPHQSPLLVSPSGASFKISAFLEFSRSPLTLYSVPQLSWGFEVVKTSMDPNSCFKHRLKHVPWQCSKNLSSLGIEESQLGEFTLSGPIIEDWGVWSGNNETLIIGKDYVWKSENLGNSQTSSEASSTVLLYNRHYMGCKLCSTMEKLKHWFSQMNICQTINTELYLYRQWEDQGKIRKSAQWCSSPECPSSHREARVWQTLETAADPKWVSPILGSHSCCICQSIRQSCLLTLHAKILSSILQSLLFLTPLISETLI